MVCVKADAYGHGLVPVAKKLGSLGVNYLGVASLDEGIALRQAGIKLPILILGLVFKDHAEPLFEHSLTATLCDAQSAVGLNNLARLSGKTIKVHIKVDTGMGRLGVLHDDALELIKRIFRFKFLDIEGILRILPLRIWTGILPCIN